MENIRYARDPQGGDGVQVRNWSIEVGFIRPLDYPSGLANLVLIEKTDGSWCVCVDYTSLNKECHKDGYPLPQTYQIFDCTALYELLSFLDAYTGYHQISLAFDNKEKTMFITPFGVFCYTKMAFSHKNGGGGSSLSQGHTDHLGYSNRTESQTYIDDVVVKSKKHGDLLGDLKKHSATNITTRWSLILKNPYSVYHQGSCSDTWYRLGESTLIQRRSKPSNNWNHPEPEEKSRSQQSWWKYSTYLYLCWWTRYAFLQAAA
jgi:hypothetical protein